ncbi:MAG: hypothetical protein GF317_19235 [Candidatus Lokiarchaeota archaeon]|nr:hypothetical protein [Candidatus Lokiarchaeota archaeon]
MNEKINYQKDSYLNITGNKFIELNYDDLSADEFESYYIGCDCLQIFSSLPLDIIINDVGNKPYYSQTNFFFRGIPVEKISIRKCISTNNNSKIIIIGYNPEGINFKTIDYLPPISLFNTSGVLIASGTSFTDINFNLTTNYTDKLKGFILKGCQFKLTDVSSDSGLPSATDLITKIYFTRQTFSNIVEQDKIVSGFGSAYDFSATNNYIISDFNFKDIILPNKFYVRIYRYNTASQRFLHYAINGQLLY